MTALLGAFSTVAAILASWLGYLTIRRQRSGRIRTTEAADLWKESNAMRQELRAEVAERRAETQDCKRELGEVRKEVARLKALIGEP